MLVGSLQYEPSEVRLLPSSLSSCLTMDTSQVSYLIYILVPRSLLEPEVGVDYHLAGIPKAFLSTPVNETEP